MDDLFLPLIIGLACQCTVLYFIIQAATKSEKQSQQNDEIISLLKVIAKSNGASPADIYNSQSAKRFSVRMPDDSGSNTFKVKAKTADIAKVKYNFDQDTQNRVNAAEASGQEFVEIDINN